MTTTSELTPAGHRFALRRPTFDVPSSDPVPETAPEPFGVRFFEPAVAVDGLKPIPHRYSTELQVAVTDDGTDTPLVTTIESWDRTTTGQLDGNKQPQEEFTMDYCGD